MYFGQAHQDKFTLQILNGKKNGYFLEIGSNDPIYINNTYLLETQFNWKGIMVEYDSNFLPLYKDKRPNSIHVIQDASTIDYKTLFETNNVPFSIDYLQIDLEEGDGSTIRTLEKLDNEVMDNYKFATVTFEHDIYHSNLYNTRAKSREIFKKRGYVCIFEDINNQYWNPYEDWYVHPDLVDMNYVNTLIQNNKNKYVNHPITGKTLNWEHIQY
jgi:hypothetical protein